MADPEGVVGEGVQSRPVRPVHDAHVPEGVVGVVLLGPGVGDLGDSEADGDTLMKERKHGSGVQWTIVIEYDSESRHYVGTVPGLDIVVDAKSERSALKLAREAIPFHLEALRRRVGIPAVPAKVLQVEV